MFSFSYPSNYSFDKLLLKAQEQKFKHKACPRAEWPQGRQACAMLTGGESVEPQKRQLSFDEGRSPQESKFCLTEKVK